MTSQFALAFISPAGVMLPHFGDGSSLRLSNAQVTFTGNFLNWVVQSHDKEIVRKLNAALREGTYTDQLWKDWTGRTVQELGDEWKKAHETRLAAVKAKADEDQRNP